MLDSIKGFHTKGAISYKDVVRAAFRAVGELSNYQHTPILTTYDQDAVNISGSTPAHFGTICPT